MQFLLPACRMLLGAGCRWRGGAADSQQDKMCVARMWLLRLSLQERGTDGEYGEISVANRLIGKVVQSQRRPLLGPSSG